MWKFRPGDVVKHKDYETLIGVVVRCKLGCEVDPDMDEGLDEPYYLITWTTTLPDEDPYQTGQEHEGQLEPIFRPMTPMGHRYGRVNLDDGFKLKS